jgi:hypothetical protein
MPVIVVFLILGAIIAFVAYWIGLREAHENQAKRIIERNRAASGWQNPSTSSTSPSERERLEAEAGLGLLDRERSHRLLYLRWEEQARGRLTQDEREQVQRLLSQWLGTPEEFRRRDEAVFDILRRAGGEPPGPLRGS